MSAAPPGGYNTITAINFTGGFPSSADLAPSIIFTILYVASLPVLAWRLISPAHRSRILIRPTIFVVIRLASMILRAVMSKTQYGVGELIAELTLISIGYLFLISPIISLWERHCIAASPPPHPIWVQRLGKLLQLTLLAAIATAIASGAMTSQAFQSNSSLNTVVNLRHASYILSLVVVVLQLLAIVATHFRFRADTARSAYLLVPTCCLLVVAVYRIAQTFENDPSEAARTLAAFWCLQILFEFFGYCSFLAISIPEWYPNGDGCGSTGRATDTEAGHKPMISHRRFKA